MIPIRSFTLLFVIVLSFSSIECEESFSHLPFSKTEENRIGYIRISDRQSSISQATWLYVKAALDHYKKSRPRFIVLELNTPGGEVFSAEQISDALKEMDTQHGISTVAFINNWALSAGALLAYSSRYITVTNDGSMGAAAPVVQGQTGEMTEASEKVNSAFRSDFANRAKFFGRNPLIAEAMVDKNILLVQRQGKIIKLNQESELRLGGEDPDIVISEKGKLLTLTADELLHYKVADLIVMPKKLVPITENEIEAGLWPASKLLLFQAPFFKEIPNAVIDEYQMDWKTAFFVFLAHPAVSSLLVLGALLGFYMEFSTPGFGAAGSMAALCLFFLVLSSFSLQLGGWLEVILLLCGLALIIVEVFILPSFGLLGFAGIVFFIAGLVGLLVPSFSSISFDFDSQSFNAAGDLFFRSLAWFFSVVLISVAMMFLLAKWNPIKGRRLSHLVLTGGEQEAALGYVSGDLPAQMPKIGAKGKVFATLRPSGKVLIEGKVFDAITPSGLLEKGKEVMVVALEGSTCVVKAC